jgi:molybdopterin molybdotransferase
MQEKVVRTEEQASFEEIPKAGDHIRRQGEDLARGAVAVAKGTRLGSAQLALIAMVDRAEVQVTRRPIVEILSTGDELRAPGSAPVTGTIPESNGVALRAMAESCGATAKVLPIVRDELAAIVKAIDGALERADVLITVGGVSVGDHDLVRPALEEVGVQLDFWKVAIKPGKPIAVGRRGHKIVIGLPGNPASAMITLALFGLPLLRAMQGDVRPFPAPLRASLARPYRHARGRQEFARANLLRTANGLAVEPVSSQASGSAVGVAGADALLSIPADSEGCAAGSEVDVFLLSELFA